MFKLKRMPKPKKRKGRKSSKPKVIKRCIALHCSNKTKKTCYDFFFTKRWTKMICAKTAIPMQKMKCVVNITGKKAVSNLHEINGIIKVKLWIKQFYLPASLRR
jgi:hypothetical protein